MFLCFIKRKIKYGAPIKLVIIPNLISLGINNVLAKRSPVKINNDPTSAETGITILLSGPTISLVMWGIIIPTKAKIPLTATEIEVINVAIVNITNLSLLTLSPSDFAESSDKESMLILLE